MTEDSAPAAPPQPGAGRILLLLSLVNLLNFFDRTLPAVVNEPIRREWGLSDLELGLVNSAFVVVYALAGIPLGRLSDIGPRRKLLAGGLAAWSLLTAATGLAGSYLSFFLARLGVGVGEATCAPASASLIGDLYPPKRRSRAMGLYMLGLPLGLTLSYAGGGALVQALGGWRGPFFLAAVPGLLLAAFVWRIREPARGAAEAGLAEAGLAGKAAVERPLRALLRIPTLFWIILSGVTVNFAAYAGTGFLVSLLQRWHRLPIDQAAGLTGLMVGLSGLVGLTAGGWLADRVHARWRRGRLFLGAGCLFAAGPLTWFALRLGPEDVAWFAWLFGVGWLGYYGYFVTVYPAIQDVVVPRLRGGAMALYFAGMYLLGGAAGSAVVGALSDHGAKAAMAAAGAAVMEPRFAAAGLREAMLLVPSMLLATAALLVFAALRFPADAARVQAASNGDAGPRLN